MLLGNIEIAAMLLGKVVEKQLLGKIVTFCAREFDFEKEMVNLKCSGETGNKQEEFEGQLCYQQIPQMLKS